ncbi:MAG: DUF4294 domain-containing protein [Bacteroidales bacterium]|nr:DUF4294 domain-containing protein [Bacteroidales bacterium]
MKKVVLGIVLVVFILLNDLTAQRGSRPNIVPARVENGDTTAIITLQSVTVFSPLVFESKREKRKFYRLIKQVKKVYPYARLAGIEFRKVEDKLKEAESYRERREIAKKVEQKIKKRYEDELKKLRFTQGKILIKLIDRETSYTSYVILEEMRGRLIAGFWQGLGKLFGYNLKNAYDPENNEFDHDVEIIVQMIEAGML